MYHKLDHKRRGNQQLEDMAISPKAHLHRCSRRERETGVNSAYQDSQSASQAGGTTKSQPDCGEPERIVIVKRGVVAVSFILPLQLGRRRVLFVALSGAVPCFKDDLVVQSVGEQAVEIGRSGKAAQPLGAWRFG